MAKNLTYKQSNITLKRVITVDRQWVFAVQYRSILWYDGPFPGWAGKHIRLLNLWFPSNDNWRHKPPRTTCIKIHLPVTPSCQYSRDKDEQEGHVRDPHDDSHGIHAEDCPGRRQRGRHRFGATGIWAVLTGAGARAVLQALGAGVRVVVHGSKAGHWNVWAKGQNNTTNWDDELCSGNNVRKKDLPENIGIIGKGDCPLLMSNIYWIQLVALQSFASFPHSSDKAFTLLDGAWTSLQALYMAVKRSRDCI